METNRTETARRLDMERADFTEDVREEVIRKAETMTDLFAAADAAKLAPLGKYNAILVKPKGGWSKSIVHGVQIYKNGALDPEHGETNSFVPLVFKEAETDMLLIARKYKDDGGNEHRMSRGLYATNVESLRNNLNRQYCGAALAMSTKQMLDFMTEHPVDLWISWDIEYNAPRVDFFDREAWLKAKREKAQAAAEARKQSGENRITEEKATA